MFFTKIFFSFAETFQLARPIREFLAPYIFWTLLVLMGLLLVFIIVVLLYPRTYTKITLEDGTSGTLLLGKSAIESYVKTILEASGFMKSPNVKVALYKKKFKVDVVGKVIPRVGITEKVAQIEKDIVMGLETFFGITKKVDYTVKVKHLETKESRTSSRVE
ncbi:alkaline shock response membrane anchor protein AmaP [Streptococcus parasuis]|uniref:alkaline shock response membrane anchor protein AmaP n=1 Tax=Streptococcus parasuis TaxID=1501662 RepID=UPI001C2CA93F|nr:alkaline shock response membrane anchor protein AmaP [Streptococcus parasuis]QXF06414.1 alkaline shock response membrane anchor protein AmaP [Streptococcus parasuis]